MLMDDEFLARLHQVQERIAAAARRSGRTANDVTLVAVTKTHPVEVVQAAYSAGLRDFGENRVEGLQARQALGLTDARWHMMGHPQSRKVKDLIGICDVVHSVDRLSVAQELSKRMTLPTDENREMGNGNTATSPLYPPLRDGEREIDRDKLSFVSGSPPVGRGPTLDILLQVNVSGEASKGGWHLTTDQAFDAFGAEVAHILTLPGVRVRGLMTMAPYYENPEKTRPIFVHLRRVQTQLQIAFPPVDVGWLSMGMTNDYEIAIEEGATHVRIGTALFGERP
jgi:uncharacterized pyridoxal phosphate-containing UPF0001 family protein